MSLTIVLSNQKGGVGKTTSAYVLSTALKEKGYKVLAVDMDPQGNLSFAMGADTESATIYDVLKGELKPGMRFRNQPWWISFPLISFSAALSWSLPARAGSFF